MNEDLTLTAEERELIEARRQAAEAKRKKREEADLKGEFDIDSIRPGMSLEAKTAAKAAITKHWS